MNFVCENYGLSARRKASVWNNKIMSPALALIACLLFSSCDQKGNGQSIEDTKEKVAHVNDTLNQPKVNIKVNKQYDDKGNLVRFDSTYSSFYSNKPGDARISNMNRFMPFFDSRFSLSPYQPYNFLPDTLRYPRFFNYDPFLQPYDFKKGQTRAVNKKGPVENGSKNTQQRKSDIAINN